MAIQNYFSINFLDVGQGDGNFIVCPGTGESILIDLGSKKNAKVAGGDAIKYLETQLEALKTQRKLAKPTLDLVILTHPDGDHYNLMNQLKTKVAGLDILELCYGGRSAEYSKAFRQRVLNPLLKIKPNRVFSFNDQQHDGEATATWNYSGGDVKLFLLSANVPDVDSDDLNAKSVVTMFVYKGNRIIMTGDAEGTTENKILGWFSKAFLLSLGQKLGHHGAKAGTTKKWLDVVQPESVFVSSDQKWAHPYCETIQRVEQSKRLRDDSARHPWLCGQGANENKQYINHFDQQWIYTTLAFQRTIKPGKNQAKIIKNIVAEYDPKGTLPDGGVQGLQYELRISAAGDVDVKST